MTLPYPRPARIVAIDPGIHIGTAIFEHGRWDEETQQVEDHKGWLCTTVAERDMDTFAPWLQGMLLGRHLDGIVFETWQLYPDKMKSLTGSKCETAEVIGQIKWLHREATMRGYPVDLAELPAGAKLPMPAWCKRRKIKATYKRLGVTGQHCKDAELLGWAYLAKITPNSVPVSP
jgi:hypothetical protein